MTLSQHLQNMYPDTSKRTIKSWILHKRISVNGQITTKPHLSILPTDKVVLNQKSKPDTAPFEILYQDDHLVFIDKPINLLSVPLNDAHKEINAMYLLRKHLNLENLYPVHRIDRDTSGVLVFTKTFPMRQSMKELFKNHDIERTYTAIIHGSLKKTKGTISSYLKELKNLSVTETNNSQGKLAITHYETLQTTKNYSKVKVTLETGRKHQIRYHLFSEGHPIVGDKRYHQANKRLFLHAQTLGFIHPITGEKIFITSKLPPVFSSLLSSDDIL
ncbi:MAG TPA: RluA family pseudouridine synthase [Chlamydiales bacterium]|nr:RluA family pseudouridine synthase [Chlamydiales bacterium]